jgi:hypothetical protein
MRQFLKNLFRAPRTTKTRPERRPDRTSLRVEGLEDRMVLSTASPLGPSLLVNPSQVSSVVSHSEPSVKLTTTKASISGHVVITGESITLGQPGTIYIQSDGHGNTVVTEQGQNPIQIPTLPLRSFSLSVQNQSYVYIDDSNGMPFADGTSVDLNGTGADSVYLIGSQTVGGNETYVPGSISTVHLGGPGGLNIIRDTPATLSLNNLNIQFVLGSSFGSPLGGRITDVFPITGTLDVHASGTQVQLVSYGPGGGQYMSGLGNGAGSFLAYDGKPSVTLDASAPKATIFLDAPDAAVGESYFTVNMHGAGEMTTLDQTPENVTTVVNVDPPATKAIVAVWGNFGPVIIDGDSTTAVNIGYPLASTGTITSGIEANVTVEGASSLVVNNSGNVSTFEYVTVTDQSISGSGLFGNSNVTLTYGGIPSLVIVTGQVGDLYTVAPSSPNAVFTSAITIDSSSYYAFQVNVEVTRASHLNLTLYNRHPQEDGGGVLDVTTRGVALDISGAQDGNGTVDATYLGRTTSRIFYNGFDNVG